MQHHLPVLFNPSFFEPARQGSSRPDHTCRFPLTFPHSQLCTTQTTLFTARDWSALYQFAKCTLSVCRPENQRQVIFPQAAHVYFELLLSHPPTQNIYWNSSNRCTHGSVGEALLQWWCLKREEIIICARPEGIDWQRLKKTTDISFNEFDHFVFVVAIL